MENNHKDTVKHILISAVGSALFYGVAAVIGWLTEHAAAVGGLQTHWAILLGVLAFLCAAIALNLVDVWLVRRRQRNLPGATSQPQRIPLETGRQECPDRWPHQLADSQKEDVSPYVHFTEWQLSTIDLGGTLPCVRFSFELYNASLFDVAIEDNIKGHINFNGHRLEGAILPYQWIVNEIPTKGTPIFFTIEQRLAPAELQLISNSLKQPDARFELHWLKIAVKGGKESPDVRRRQLRIARPFIELYRSDARLKELTVECESKGQYISTLQGHIFDRDTQIQLQAETISSLQDKINAGCPDKWLHEIAAAQEAQIDSFVRVQECRIDEMSLVKPPSYVRFAFTFDNRSVFDLIVNHQTGGYIMFREVRLGGYLFAPENKDILIPHGQSGKLIIEQRVSPDEATLIWQSDHVPHSNFIFRWLEISYMGTTDFPEIAKHQFAITDILDVSRQGSSRQEMLLSQENAPFDEDNWLFDANDGWTIADRCIRVTRCPTGGLFKSGIAWSDYAFNFQFKIVNEYAGWIIRARDRDHYLMIQCGHAQIRLHTRMLGEDGIVETRLERPMIPIDSTQEEWTKVRTEVLGAAIRIWINEKVIWSSSNFLNRFQFGTIGFRCDGSEEALFRNIYVQSLS
jgi:hypothetical protein